MPAYLSPRAGACVRFEKHDATQRDATRAATDAGTRDIPSQVPRQSRLTGRDRSCGRTAARGPCRIQSPAAPVKRRARERGRRAQSRVAWRERRERPSVLFCRVLFSAPGKRAQCARRRTFPEPSSPVSSVGQSRLRCFFVLTMNVRGSSAPSTAQHAPFKRCGSSKSTPRRQDNVNDNDNSDRTQATSERTILRTEEIEGDNTRLASRFRSHPCRSGTRTQTSARKRARPSPWRARR